MKLLVRRERSGFSVVGRRSRRGGCNNLKRPSRGRSGCFSRTGRIRGTIIPPLPPSVRGQATFIPMVLLVLLVLLRLYFSRRLACAAAISSFITHHCARRTTRRLRRARHIVPLSPCRRLRAVTFCSGRLFWTLRSQWMSELLEEKPNSRAISFLRMYFTKYIWRNIIIRTWST